MPRVCITVPDKNAQPYRFSLDRSVVRFGRAEDNDIVIDSPSVSSHHCEMHRIDGGYILKDSDSTNGIKLEGTRMETIDLINDAEVHIGDADLDFELTPEEVATLSEEDHTPREQAKLPPVQLEESDPEPRPAPRPAPPRAAQPLASAQSSGGANFMISMVLLALAILSFYFGMATRHQAKTGRSLMDDIMGNEAPAVKAEGEKAAE